MHAYPKFFFVSLSISCPSDGLVIVGVHSAKFPNEKVSVPNKALKNVIHNLSTSQPESVTRHHRAKAAICKLSANEFNGYECEIEIEKYAQISIKSLCCCQSLLSFSSVSVLCYRSIYQWGITHGDRESLLF